MTRRRWPWVSATRERALTCQVGLPRWPAVTDLRNGLLYSALSRCLISGPTCRLVLYSGRIMHRRGLAAVHCSECIVFSDAVHRARLMCVCNGRIFALLFLSEYYLVRSFSHGKVHLNMPQKSNNSNEFMKSPPVSFFESLEKRLKNSPLGATAITFRPCCICTSSIRWRAPCGTYYFGL